MNFGDFKDGKAQQPLPSSLAPHESEISGFANLCNKTCNRILNLLALGLEVCTKSSNSKKNRTDRTNPIIDPTRLLHFSPRPYRRPNWQHPTVPILSINILTGNSILQA